MKTLSPVILILTNEKSQKRLIMDSVPNVEVRHAQVEQISDLLRRLPPNQPVLLLRVGEQIRFSKGWEERLPVLGDEVMLPASSELRMEDDSLGYFYWKHAPRPHFFYNFPDASVLFGRAGKLSLLIADVFEKYPGSSWQEGLARYYFDSQAGAFATSVSMRLDHEQKWMVSTQFSLRKRTGRNWLLALLFARREQEASFSKPYVLNVKEQSGSLLHYLTKTRPLLAVVHGSNGVGKEKATFLDHAGLRWSAIKDYAYVWRINRGHLSKVALFRYAPNRAPEVQRATEWLVDRLEKKQPLSFAHYNDGELTFIRDFLEGKNHKKWFGRKQQQYDPLLAERLLGAMKFQKEGYFVGVPCGTDHPPLRRLADELVGDYAFKVPAMTIHHNLAYLPRLLYALKERKITFFRNEYQDLAFFQRFGIQVAKERVFTVPFKNSYLEYDRWKDMVFEKDEVVVLTCGMLAKILTKAWFEQHDSLTALALGSSVDDLIQEGKIHFELFPPETPVTRNIHHSRSFLFGYKKPCPECYQLKG